MSNDAEKFSNLIQNLKSSRQTEVESDLVFSESSKRALFLKLREIESRGSSSISWDLLANYFPRFSLVSAAVAMCSLVTFQLSSPDVSYISFYERIESEGLELIAGSDQEEDFDPADLIVEEQQSEEV